MGFARRADPRKIGCHRAVSLDAMVNAAYRLDPRLLMNFGRHCWAWRR